MTETEKTINKIARDTLLLSTIDGRVAKLEEKDKWWNRTLVTSIISVLIGIGWFLLEKSNP